jgi:hypothetical protein
MSGIQEKVMTAALATTAPSNELRTILEGKGLAVPGPSWHSVSCFISYVLLSLFVTFCKGYLNIVVYSVQVFCNAF